VDIYIGVSTFRVGSETSFAQIVAEVIGMDVKAVRVHAGDTGASPLNTCGVASRTLIAAAGRSQARWRGGARQDPADRRLHP
jgi:aerobic carbon-monoxide dehydrogenase large subunit